MVWEIEWELTSSGRRGEDEGEGEREGGMSVMVMMVMLRDDLRMLMLVRYEWVILVSVCVVGVMLVSGGFGVVGFEVFAASFKECEVVFKVVWLMESGVIDDYLVKCECEGGIE